MILEKKLAFKIYCKPTVGFYISHIIMIKQCLNALVKNFVIWTDFPQKALKLSGII